VRSKGAVLLPAGPSIFTTDGLTLASPYSSLDTFKLGLAVVDRKFRFRTVNGTLAKMNNAPREYHTGKTVDTVLGTLASKVESLFDRVFSTGMPFGNIQLSGRLPRRHDLAHWTEYFFPIKDKRNRVVQVGAFVAELELDHLAPENGSGPALSLQNRQLHHKHHHILSGSHQPEVHAVDTSPAILTVREREVLRLLALGKCNKDVSSILAISVRTVETYRGRVMLKTQAHSIAQLVRYALRHKIVEPWE
jgi:DNA-binding CsgD family transcriptional regulator